MTKRWQRARGLPNLSLPCPIQELPSIAHHAQTKKFEKIEQDQNKSVSGRSAHPRRHFRPLRIISRDYIHPAV